MKPPAEASSSRDKKKRKVNTNVKNEKSKEKDSDVPKRPAEAFFIFLEDFRKFYKEEIPENKRVANVAKAGGETWGLMSLEDKTPYFVEADKRKADYKKAVESYNKSVNDAEDEAKDEDSDKLTSEVESHQDEGDENEP
ncbi:hypothetical protein NE237_033003 [Protea cynaroides]|uniref:HMG box domain-containing protein n=1 Tax=Protea cynaroides TaxID=273540 RepID=A0A9Q0L4L1_9MAGN|nr:hypothetical protein NE237_033003 [Protea cynaroides]